MSFLQFLIIHGISAAHFYLLWLGEFFAFSCNIFVFYYYIFLPPCILHAPVPCGADGLLGDPMIRRTSRAFRPIS